MSGTLTRSSFIIDIATLHLLIGRPEGVINRKDIMNTLHALSVATFCNRRRQDNGESKIGLAIMERRNRHHGDSGI